MSSPSVRLGQKMDNGQTDRDTFVPWPAHCSQVVLNLTVYKYIEETKPACSIPCGSGWGTTRTGRLYESFGPKGSVSGQSNCRAPPDW